MAHLRCIKVLALRKIVWIIFACASRAAAGRGEDHHINMCECNYFAVCICLRLFFLICFSYFVRISITDVTVSWMATFGCLFVFFPMARAWNWTSSHFSPSLQLHFAFHLLFSPPSNWVSLIYPAWRSAGCCSCWPCKKKKKMLSCLEAWLKHNSPASTLYPAARPEQWSQRAGIRSNCKSGGTKKIHKPEWFKMPLEST